MRRLRAAAFLLLIAPARAQLRAAPESLAPVAPVAPIASPLAAIPALAPASSLSLLSAPALTPSLLVSAPLAAASPLAVSAAAVSAPADEPAKPAASASAAAPASAPAALPALRAGSTLSGRHLNAFWDGFAAPETEDPASELFRPDAAGAADEPASGAPFLALRDRRLAPAFERAIALARSTKAGAQALDEAEAALGGRVLRVEVKDLGRNYGEWDYLNDRLRLDRKLFEPGREADLAGTLAHELKHVAQHALGLPSNALELEIEAHLLDLAIMDELGLKTRPNTFSRQLADALKKSPDAFVALIQAAVPGSPYLGEQSFADIEDQLEQDLDDLAEKSGARSQKLAAQIESDIALLKSKKGRAAYEAFSKRVRAELKRRVAAAR
jgi:hypothetical protein